MIHWLMICIPSWQHRQFKALHYHTCSNIQRLPAGIVASAGAMLYVNLYATGNHRLKKSPGNFSVQGAIGVSQQLENR